MSSRGMSLRSIIQILVLFIGVAFEAVRTGQGKITLFLISGQLEWFRSYVYNFCEHIKFITISIMMWGGCRMEDHQTDKLFVILACIDFFDYLITGNNLWWSFTIIPHGTGFGLIVPMSMNVLSLVVFGLFIFIQWRQRMNG